MRGPRLPHSLVAVGIAAFAALAFSASSSPATAAAGAPPGGGFYVPQPDPPAMQQIAKLKADGDSTDAALLAALQATPRAVWIDGGTPNQARVSAQTTTLRAEGRRQVPVLVLYNIPGRDCSGYSAGGATGLASYDAWIDGVASGIGDRRAIVILEPDSLGLLPQANCGSTTFTDSDRFAELNYAVDTPAAARARGSTSTPRTAPGRQSATLRSGSSRRA
jgi:endoglucanase